jgi:hypothetical protein
MTNPAAQLVDATTPLTVIIGEQDRVGALRCSPTHCIGANRLRRLPGVLDARVGAGSARIQRRDGWHRYDLHPDTVAAVHAYDAAGERMPARGRFRLIPPHRPLGARTGTTPGSNRRSGRRDSVAARRPSTRSLFIEPPGT